MTKIFFINLYLVATPAQHYNSENTKAMIYLINSFDHYEPVLSIPVIFLLYFCN